MKKKTVSESAKTAVIATRYVIRSGEVGLDFTSPDDATIEWTKNGLFLVLARIIEHDDSREILADLVNDLLHEASYEQHQLLEDHPDWAQELAEFEAEEREWESEEARDIRSRVNDMNRGMV